MKTKIFVLIVSSLLFVTACNKDKTVPPPVISNLEIGLENNKIGYIGEELHIEASIVAEGRIERITIQIHYEGEQKASLLEIEWNYNHMFTETVSGLKNFDLHFHIDIPAQVKPGEYHFHLTVVDKEGNSTSVEEDIIIAHK